GVVAQDELDFPAINRCAILLHIEPGARFDLLARRRKRSRHGKNETDLDGLFGHCVRRGQRKRCQSGQCPPHSFVLQFIRYQRSSFRFLPNARGRPPHRSGGLTPSTTFSAHKHRFPPTLPPPQRPPPPSTRRTSPS